MCVGGGAPNPPKPAPLAAPQSDQVRRAGALEAAARRRAAGIQGDILVAPLGIPSGASLRLGG
jgi:hypothetical protein